MSQFMDIWREQSRGRRWYQTFVFGATVLALSTHLWFLFT